MLAHQLVHNRGAKGSAHRVIKYLGSKRLLVPAIVELVRSLPGVRTVGDLFSGTARVGHALKECGYEVTANDHNAYAATLARCYVQADGARVRSRAARIIEELNGIPGRAGYFTETFCVRSRFFQPHNGERVDAIRDRISEMAVEPDLEAVLLVSLMEAADRVDSTCGVQMAYLKTWAARSYHPLLLRLPRVLDGPGRALCCDVFDASEAQRWDLVYLDPPYNQHKYRGNYHVWETLVRWDRPEVYGTACKRVDCKEHRSDFNSKRRIHESLRALVARVRAEHVLLSFNSEGYLTHDEIVSILSPWGEVSSCGHDYKRYVGAQIGIFNRKGERVGKVRHLRNQEFLFHLRKEPTPG